MVTKYNSNHYSSGSGFKEPPSHLSEDKADALSETLISKDGKVLGGLLTLPKGLHVVYDIIAPKLKYYVSEFGGDKVELGVKLAAKKMHVDPKTAGEIAKISGKVTSYTIPYIDNIADLNKTRKIHKENMNIVMQDIKPLLAANKKAHIGGHSGYAGDKIIESAVKTVVEITHGNLSQDATNLIPNAIVNYTTHTSRQLAAAKSVAAKPAAASQAATPGDIKPLSGAEKKLQKDQIKSLEKKLANLQDWGTSAGGAIQAGAEEYIKNQKLDDLLANTSYGAVMQVSHYLHENSLDGLTKSSGDTNHVEEVARLVEEVFNRVQKEQKRLSLPSARLTEVSTKIAEDLVSGDMCALSLFNIVGREELLSSTKTGFLPQEKIEKLLHKEVQTICKRDVVDSAQYLEGKEFTLDDLRIHAHSKDKHERELFVLLVPDGAARDAGMTQKEIDEIRHRDGNNKLELIFAPLVKNLARMPDEELQKKGLDESDIQSLREAAEKGVLAAFKGPDKGENLKAKINDIIMGQDSTYWRDKMRGDTDKALAAQGGSAATKDDVTNHAAAIYGEGKGAKTPVQHAAQSLESEQGFSKS